MLLNASDQAKHLKLLAWYQVCCWSMQGGILTPGHNHGLSMAKFTPNCLRSWEACWMHGILACRLVCRAHRCLLHLSNKFYSSSDFEHSGQNLRLLCDNVRMQGTLAIQLWWPWDSLTTHTVASNILLRSCDFHMVTYDSVTITTRVCRAHFVGHMCRNIMPFVPGLYDVGGMIFGRPAQPKNADIVRSQNSYVRLWLRL